LKALQIELVKFLESYKNFRLENFVKVCVSKFGAAHGSDDCAAFFTRMAGVLHAGCDGVQIALRYLRTFLMAVLLPLVRWSDHKAHIQIRVSTWATSN
jgi:L-cystine uptake protein TcyP (sodium:dicarboxylate symporter family)